MGPDLHPSVVDVCGIDAFGIAEIAKGLFGWAEQSVKPPALLSLMMLTASFSPPAAAGLDGPEQSEAHLVVIPRERDNEAHLHVA